MIAKLGGALTLLVRYLLSRHINMAFAQARSCRLIQTHRHSSMPTSYLMARLSGGATRPTVLRIQGPGCDVRPMRTTSAYLQAILHIRCVTDLKLSRHVLSSRSLPLQSCVSVAACSTSSRPSWENPSHSKSSRPTRSTT